MGTIVMASPLGEEIDLPSPKDDLRSVFNYISQHTGIPILFEGSPEKNTPVSIPLQRGSVKKILNSLCGEKYQWSMHDGVLIFQDKKIIDDPDYPINKYKFDFEISTDDLEKFLQERVGFDQIWKRRIICWLLQFEYGSKKPFYKTYKNASLRDVLIDFLKDSHSVAVTWQYSPKTTALLYDQIKKNRDININTVSDSDKPLYGINVSSYPLISSYEFKGRTVEKGNNLLVSTLSLRKGKDVIVFDINLKNISKEMLIVRNSKKNIMIHDISCENDRWGIDDVRSLLIYPTNIAALKEKIELIPGQQINISFPIIGARSQTYWGLSIWNKEFDEQVDLSKYPVNVLKSAPAFNKFDVVVYFFDTKGKEYKSFTYKLLHSRDIE